MSEASIQPEPKRIPTAQELGFDPAALRQKYAAERAKRLRADGNNQYQEVSGALEHFERDVRETCAKARQRQGTA